MDVKGRFKGRMMEPEMANGKKATQGKQTSDAHIMRAQFRLVVCFGLGHLGLLDRLEVLRWSGLESRGYFARFHCLGKEHDHCSGYVLGRSSLRCSFLYSTAAAAVAQTDVQVAADLDLGQRLGVE